MSSPRATTVIPAYNRPGLLADVIESGMGQTARDIEIIVSENASPPVSEAVVKSFNDPRLTFRRNDENLGIAGNIRMRQCGAGHCMRPALPALARSAAGVKREPNGKRR